MGLFSIRKKNSDNLHTLTEKEIQAKLYGKFFTEQDSFVEESIAPVKNPAQNSPELFRPPAAETPSRSNVPPTLEERPVRNVAEPKPKAKDRAVRKEDSRIFQHLGEALEKISQAILKIAIAGGVAFLRVMAAVLIRLGQFLAKYFDFRNPQTRRTLSWAGAFAFLCFIFIAIHFLNVKRVAAMRSPHPFQVPVETVEKVTATKSVSVPAAESNSPLTPVTKSTPVETAGKASPPAIQQESPAAAPYVIQIATFVAKNDADRLAAELQKGKLTSFVKPFKRSGEKVYYSVFLGRYKDFSEAQKQLAEFRKHEISKSFHDAFVRALD